jgi:hypothetical protein
MLLSKEEWVTDTPKSINFKEKIKMNFFNSFAIKCNKKRMIKLPKR